MKSKWKEYKLGDITTWASGGTPPKNKEEAWGGDIPWISASSMNGNRYRDSKLKVTEIGLKGSKLATKHSILLLVRGSILHQKIQVGITERDVAFNQDVKSLVVNNDIVDPWFLLFWFMSKKPEILSMVENTGIGAGKLDTKLMQNLLIKIPLLKERNAITLLLKAIDDKIELNRQMNKTLEQMAQAMFKSWFVDFDPVFDNAIALGKDVPEELQEKLERRSSYAKASKDKKVLPKEIQELFPDEFELTEEMGWVPKGWRIRKLGDISKILNGYAFKSADYTDQGVFVLRTKNFDANGLSSRRNDDVFLPNSFLTSHDVYRSQTFDFHLVMVGASIGKTSLLLPHMLPALRNQNMWCFRPKASLVSRTFLNLSLQRKISEVMAWASGSARSFFRKSDFKNHEILVPPKCLLLTFEDITGSMFLNVSVNSAESDSLTKLRDTLLPKLVGGEVRVGEEEVEE